MSDEPNVIEDNVYEANRKKLRADKTIKEMAAEIHTNGAGIENFVHDGTRRATHEFMMMALEKYRERAEAAGREVVGTHIGGPSEVILELAFPPAYDTPIAALNISSHTLNRLKGEKIDNVGQLVRRTEKDLLDIRHFGTVALEEVKVALDGLGVALKPEPTPRPPAAG